jgi:hypothetical protein
MMTATSNRLSILTDELRSAIDAAGAGLNEIEDAAVIEAGRLLIEAKSLLPDYHEWQRW